MAFFTHASRRPLSPQGMMHPHGQNLLGLESQEVDGSYEAPSGFSSWLVHPKWLGHEIQSALAKQKKTDRQTMFKIPGTPIWAIKPFDSVKSLTCENGGVERAPGRTKTHQIYLVRPLLKVGKARSLSGTSKFSHEPKEERCPVTVNGTQHGVPNWGSRSPQALLERSSYGGWICPRNLQG